MNHATLILPVQDAATDSPDLLARARAGDGESFALLCEPLKDRLFRQALALCRDQAQAQDLSQEVLLEAWKSLHRYNGQCQLATWFCSILLHRHKSALRRARWRAWLEPFSAAEHEPALMQLRDAAPAPDQALQLSERSRLILATLERLPAAQREVVFLRFYADASLAEIAAALQCSLGTVKSRLFHSLENLRRMNVFKEELP